jgi:hypothetical protein
LVAKVLLFFLNFYQYLYEQTMILSLPIKILATQYESVFSFYYLMSQIYEITGLFGVIFVILTSTASAVYL